MNPEHIWNWTRVIFAIVLLTVVVVFYRDYHGASVNWRVGQVTDKKERSSTDRDGRTRSTDYYICVNVSGQNGKVCVDQWEYRKWHVGEPCEVSFRHGRIRNYDFAEIRPQGSETQGRGWWLEGRRDWW